MEDINLLKLVDTSPNFTSIKIGESLHDFREKTQKAAA